MMKRRVRLERFVFLFILGFFAEAAWAQDGRIDFDASHSVDWVRGKVSSQFSFNLAQAGIKLPTRRTQGEDILEEAYSGLLRPFLLSLRADSNSTVRDMLDRKEITLAELDDLCLEAEKVPPSLSADLTRMSGKYTVAMEKIGALLTRHRQVVEPVRPLITFPSVDYTGIIIVAQGELPVHGRRSRVFVEPCLFPKIWDTNMTLVYEKNMFDPGLKEEKLMVSYTVPENIFRATPSGLDDSIRALLGSNPLRILAREVFGASPTDPVIDREDALKILSSKNNRRLLKEGRVVLVLNENKLYSVMR